VSLKSEQRKYKLSRNKGGVLHKPICGKEGLKGGKKKLLLRGTLKNLRHSLKKGRMELFKVKGGGWGGKRGRRGIHFSFVGEMVRNMH